MKNKILKLISEKPKHFSKMIKNDEEMLNWVMNNTLLSINFTLPEHIYSAVNQIDNLCPNGNIKKYKDINNGFAFCGKANSCICCKESVSISVSTSKNNFTDEEKNIIQKKREQTSLDRYGVINNGQTHQAINAHKILYADKAKVDEINNQVKQTKLLKYGNSGYNNRAKAKKTSLKKYGVENPMQNILIAELSKKTRIDNYDPLTIYSKNYHNFVNNMKNTYNIEVLINENEYCGIASRPYVKFRCYQCNYEFEKRFDYGAPPICKNCNPTNYSYQSKEEVQVFDFISSIYNGLIIQRDKSIINPYELDMYIPEKKLAIEYCGLYWHSEISGNKSWAYHAKKLQLANSKGIRLITIFSDEWNFKSDIVKEKLKSILELITNEKIYARKCEIKEVMLSDSKQFHEKNHIQGSPQKLGKNIGLFHNNILVALGSFTKINNLGEYELVRYSSSSHVIGGAGKILAYFIRTNENLNKIISFADLRWSEGNMYKQLGFNEVSRVPAMQSYVKQDKRYHKRLFSKNKINPLNENKTEWEKMQELGYDRIWDCGKIKFVLNIQK